MRGTATRGGLAGVRLGAALACLQVASGFGAARAAAITVDSAGDTNVCNETGCTLRGAINQANDATGATPTIDFDLAGEEGPPAIYPGSALPPITRSMVIDGSGTGVAIYGFGVESGSVPGLSIAAPGVTVRGLVIGYFTGDGIEVGPNVQDTTLEGNDISGNDGAGVSIAASGGDGNTIRANSFDDNGGLAIDLGGDGVTPNDDGDSDSGPNELQNFPALDGASAQGDATRITGSLDAEPGTTYEVDFYGDDGCDPSGHGEGDLPIGSETVTTDDAGHADIDAAGLSPTFYDVFTATATDPDGNTSEMSACLTTGDGPPDPGLRVIDSAGPLTSLYLNGDLACNAIHAGDESPQFFGPAASGSCGTFVAAGDSVFGPQDVSPTTSPFYPLSQSPVTGAGTSGDPFMVVTTVGTASGLQIVQTDSYVTGEESYRTDIAVTNMGEADATGTLYHAADCYLGDDDFGYGFHDPGSGGIFCTKTANNQPSGRLEGFVPLDAGSSYLEDGYSDVWAAITPAAGPFAATCLCGTFADNGAGLGWPLDIGPGETVTRSLLTAFSPTGSFLAEDPPEPEQPPPVEEPPPAEQGRQTTPPVEPPAATPPSTPPSEEIVLPEPKRGRTTNAVPKRGEVLVRLPRGTTPKLARALGLRGAASRFIPLSEARQVPLGSTFDTKKGTVSLTTARSPKAGRPLQSGNFRGGRFKVQQSKKRSLTTLSMRGGGFGRCRTRTPRGGVKRKQDVGAARRRRRHRHRRRRHVFSSVKGRFRTRGRHSTATVRGTKWKMTDTCGKTVTRVKEGAVVVRDLTLHKRRVVRAGHRYVARAPRGRRHRRRTHR